MSYQIEFNGMKIQKAKSKTLSGARVMLYDIVLECVAEYKKNRQDKKLAPSQEILLQMKLLSGLTISYDHNPKTIYGK